MNGQIDCASTYDPRYESRKDAHNSRQACHPLGGPATSTPMPPTILGTIQRLQEIASELAGAVEELENKASPVLRCGIEAAKDPRTAQPMPDTQAVLENLGRLCRFFELAVERVRSISVRMEL